MQRFLRVTSKIFLIEVTSNNLSNTKWNIFFRSVSFAFVSRWPTASLGFSRVNWWVTRLLEEHGVDEIKGVESPEDAGIFVGVATRLVSAFAFNSNIVPIGKPNDFNWSHLCNRTSSELVSVNQFFQTILLFRRSGNSVNKCFSYYSSFNSLLHLQGHQLKLNSK